eukprot:TRINITY_DN843_c0_g1_i7.p1 TRINITY_DN843_c0_g1~~TRINITY_DN843_c0_g1_i7.p1  ORF type:complete len:470 (-),score=69.70 TRINITY_DN843_c0_g1_i7:181-1590(-)
MNGVPDNIPSEQGGPNKHINRDNVETLFLRFRVKSGEIGESSSALQNYSYLQNHFSEEEYKEIRKSLTQKKRERELEKQKLRYARYLESKREEKKERKEDEAKIEASLAFIREAAERVRKEIPPSSVPDFIKEMPHKVTSHATEDTRRQQTGCQGVIHPQEAVTRGYVANQMQRATPKHTKRPRTDNDTMSSASLGDVPVSEHAKRMRTDNPANDQARLAHTQEAVPVIPAPNLRREYHVAENTLPRRQPIWVPQMMNQDRQTHQKQQEQPSTLFQSFGEILHAKHIQQPVLKETKSQQEDDNVSQEMAISNEAYRDVFTTSPSWVSSYHPRQPNAATNACQMKGERNFQSHSSTHSILSKVRVGNISSVHSMEVKNHNSFHPAANRNNDGEPGTYYRGLDIPYKQPPEVLPTHSPGSRNTNHDDDDVQEDRLPSFQELLNSLNSNLRCWSLDDRKPTHSNFSTTHERK